MTRLVRRAAALIALSFAAAPLLAESRPLLKDGDHVAICGDSITEQKLYSLYVADYLLMCKPAAKLRATQFGWGGETTWGFAARVQSDVVPFKPTVATTFYGMNDGGYAALSDERRQKFTDATRDIVKQFKAAGIREIVVGSPGVVDTGTFKKSPWVKEPADAEGYNRTLGELAGIAKKVAGEEGVHYVDVHAAMLDVMQKAKAKYGEKYAFAGGDGVHPGPNGHLVTAYAFLKALGVDGNIGTITLDAAAGKGEASEGHKVVSASAGSIEVESTRYPFCFYGDPTKPDATRGIIEFFPFNEELNRLTLVVKNAPAEKVKVTWGDASQTFTKGQLEAGVNLAAEFADKNPFSEPFTKAENAIKAQQNFETTMVKQLFHLEPKAPADAELKEIAMRRAAYAQERSAEAVMPVRHVIKVEKAE